MPISIPNWEYTFSVPVHVNLPLALQVIVVGHMGASFLWLMSLAQFRPPLEISNWTYEASRRGSTLIPSAMGMTLLY